MQARISTKIVVNGKGLLVDTQDYFGKGVEIPGTGFYLNPDTTINDVFMAAGYRTFDLALPVNWLKQHYSRPDGSYIVPKGAWVYEGPSIFGEFVSLEDALVRLGEKINEQRTSQ